MAPGCDSIYKVHAVRYQQYAARFTQRAQALNCGLNLHSVVGCFSNGSPAPFDEMLAVSKDESPSAWAWVAGTCTIRRESNLLHGSIIAPVFA
jgi:hypothetical protein